MPNPKPSRAPWGDGFNVINRILDFLFDKFKSLPGPLRAIAYFIFLAFFCATAWRLIAGTYAIRGVVWDGDHYARGYEIRLRGDHFSTNANGMFYAVVTSTQYYRYVFSRTQAIKLPLVRPTPKGDERVAGSPFAVSFNWLDDEFTDIKTNPKVTIELKPSPSLWDLMTGVAYAQESPKQLPTQRTPFSMLPLLPARGDRLVIERIILGDDALDTKQAKFKVQAAEADFPLLLKGVQAGRLPLKDRVELGNEYYFDIPKSQRTKSVNIEMRSPIFFGLFTKEENFTVKVPADYDTIIPVKGSKGSVIWLRLAPGIFWPSAIH